VATNTDVRVTFFKRKFLSETNILLLWWQIAMWRVS
jgi:hypothetical protein